MAGYSARQSTFTTGDTITAAHSNDEFNQLLAAFNASTGHTHDGTAGDGGPVKAIRDSSNFNRILVDDGNNHLEFYVNVSSASVQQFRLEDGAIVPITNNDIDLGTSSLQFKDAFFDGTVTADAFAGPLTGNVTGNVSGTAATVTGAAQSNITSLGTLTTLTVDDITINGSTISDSGDFTIECWAYQASAAASTFAIGINDAGNTQTIQSTTGIGATNINDATNANNSMTTTIGEITQSLGALSGSLTSLKAYQNVATTTKAHLIQAASNLQDTDFAAETAKITKQSLIRNYALAMVATANSEELEKLKLLA